LWRCFTWGLDAYRSLDIGWHLMRKYGDIVQLHAPPLFPSTYFCFDPDSIKHIQLHSDFEVSTTYPSRILESWLGAESMTLLATPAAPEKRRRYYDPVFNRRAIYERAASALRREVDRMLDAMERGQRDGTAINITDLAWDLWLRVLVALLAPGGEDRLGDATFAELRRTLEFSGSEITRSYFSLTGRDQLKRGRETFERLSRRLIDHSLRDSTANPESREGVIAKIAETMGVKDDPMVEYVISWIAGGDGAIAHWLSSLIYVLGEHPDVADRIHAEVVEVDFAHTTTVDVEKLPWLNAAFLEVGRLWVGVPVFRQRAVRRTQVGPYSLEPGIDIVGFTHVANRHPDFWERPDEFDPARFLGDRRAKQPPLHNFGYGSRPCSASHLTTAIVEYATARIVERYRLHRVSAVRQKGFPVSPDGDVVLRVSRR
jgi:cytochrome P450